LRIEDCGSSFPVILSLSTPVRGGDTIVDRVPFSERRRGVYPRANSISRGDKPPGYNVIRNPVIGSETCPAQPVRANRIISSRFESRHRDTKTVPGEILRRAPVGCASYRSLRMTVLCHRDRASSGIRHPASGMWNPQSAIRSGAEQTQGGREPATFNPQRVTWEIDRTRGGRVESAICNLQSAIRAGGGKSAIFNPQSAIRMGRE